MAGKSKRPILADWELIGQLLSSFGDAAAVVDRKWRLVWVWEPLADPLDLDKKHFGARCFSIFGQNNRHCGQGCPVSPVFEDGRPHVRERHFIDPTTGKERWREARAFPIMDGSNQVAYVARISFDITERKVCEANNLHKQHRLESSLAELNRLQLAEMPFQPSVTSALTQRELEVLRLMAQGHKNPELARLLGISVNTVKRHLAHIFGKLEVNDRTQAAVWAARKGLV